MSNTVYQIITEKIIAQLGPCPFAWLLGQERRR